MATDARHDNFLALVIHMRQCQKAYFRDRRQSDLNRSKDLERRVDEMAKALRDKQRQLF